MTSKHTRPSLTSVMGHPGGGEKSAIPAVAAGSSSPTQATPPAQRRKPGRRKQGHLSLLVYVPPELHRALKMKALEESRDMSDIVTELIRKYVGLDA